MKTKSGGLGKLIGKEVGGDFGKAKNGNCQGLPGGFNEKSGSRPDWFKAENVQSYLPEKGVNKENFR